MRCVHLLRPSCGTLLPARTPLCFRRLPHLLHPHHPHANTLPRSEARWLVATCWNAGLARLRLGDRPGAAPYLRSGLAMLKRAGGAWGGVDRPAMEGVLAEVEAALGGGGGGAQPAAAPPVIAVA